MLQLGVYLIPFTFTTQKFNFLLLEASDVGSISFFVDVLHGSSLGFAWSHVAL
jgi:hypothetical protein